MKKRPKPIRLHRETLRDLVPPQLSVEALAVVIGRRISRPLYGATAQCSWTMYDSETCLTANQCG